jgi:amino acid transporter
VPDAPAVAAAAGPSATGASPASPILAAGDAALVRAIGTGGLTASILNIVVGSGIFVLPATAAGILGPTAPLGWLAAAAVMLLVTLCFAQAGSRVARSGGVAAYAEEAFGPFAGHMVGTLLWISNVLGSAAVAVALMDVLSTRIPALGGGLARGGTLALLYAAFVAVNARGVRAGTRAATAATIAKFLPLLVFLAVGATLVRPEHLAGAGSPAVGGVGRATLLLVWAFSGIEVALGASGEVREPSRTIPRALLLALAIVLALYVAIQVTAQGILGPALPGSRAPLSDALAAAGEWGRLLVLAGAAISMLGFLPGDLLGSSRILYALGREGRLPRALGRVHAATRVPLVAIVTHAAVALALAITGTFAALIAVSTLGAVVVYGVGCAAAWVLRRRDPEAPGAFRVPGGALVPVLAIACLTWVALQGTRRELAAVALAALAAAAIWLVPARLPAAGSAPGA